MYLITWPQNISNKTTHTQTHTGETKTAENKKKNGDFPGGPVGKTPRSQHRRPGFDLWSGN